MKIIYWIIYFVLISILLFIAGVILGIIACVIPRLVGLYILNYGFCNMDSCPTEALRFQIGAELMIAPILYGIILVVFFARKSFISAFTKKKSFIIFIIWLLLLICSCYTTHMTSFKLVS